MKRIIKNIIPNSFTESLQAYQKIWILYKMLKKQEMQTHYNQTQIKEVINQAYQASVGKNINWMNPKSYTEKLNVSKLFNANDKKRYLSDKYCVRKWVQDTVGKDYLIPMIGIYGGFESIDFDTLPDSFVMKCTHDSGSTMIVNDKKMIKRGRMRILFNLLQKRNMALLNFEMQYKNIQPRIIIEKNMGERLSDYKFLCFNGKPYYCWVDVDRYGNHRRCIFDLEWNRQPFNQMNYGTPDEPIERPENFEEMVSVATKLCYGFDHVRVDLYNIKGEVYFGEMTFTNGNGMQPIIPNSYDLMLGDLWEPFVIEKIEKANCIQ